MCEMYSTVKDPDMIGRIVNRLASCDDVRISPFGSIQPNKVAPVITQNASGSRAIEAMRWGFPPLPYLPCRGITLTFRDASSGYWRQWLNPSNRCLVPATAFCHDHSIDDMRVWFARPPDGAELRPLFFFAGICRTWTGVRETKGGPIEGEHRLYTVLTTQPNTVVREIGVETTPVILSTSGEIEQWLDGTLEEALSLHRPAPDESLVVVSREHFGIGGKVRVKAAFSETV